MPEQTTTSYINTRASDFRSVYSNNANFNTTLFDFSIIFGEVIEASQIDERSGTVTVEQKVKIIMSPLHAKIFIGTLVGQLQAYEQRFGEIKIPDETLGARQNQESETT
jgi:hypothetical protein